MQKGKIILLEEKCEQWLNNSTNKGIDFGLATAESLLSELIPEISRNSEARILLGPLIGKIKSIRKKLKKIKRITWSQVYNGSLTIGHRPGGRIISNLKVQGVDYILTLLSEAEGAREIEKGCHLEGIKWIWFPMASARIPGEEKSEIFRELFAEMTKILKNKAKLYLHCSVGIHRTGMITYAFLRYVGLSAFESRNKLKELRIDTWQAVGDNRLLWGDNFANLGKEHL
jgi:hypothetical protein